MDFITFSFFCLLIIVSLFSEHPLLTALLGPIILIVFINLYKTFMFSYWGSRGIDNLDKYASCYFGNMQDIFMLFESMASFLRQAYEMNPERSMLGLYFYGTPALLLKDPELIKQVLVTKRQHFGPFMKFNERAEPLLAHSPLFTNEDNWTYVEFSEERMRRSFDDLQGLCDDFILLLNGFVCKNGKKGYTQIESDMKLNVFSTMLMLRFGVGRTVANDQTRLFGPICSEIRSIFAPQHFSTMRQNYGRYAPRLARLLGLKLVSRRMEKQFRQAVDEILKIRDQLHPDCFLNWLYIDAGDHEPDRELIVRQLFAFFFEIYLVTTIIANFALYLLGANNAEQDTLLKDIDKALKKSGRVVTYDVLENIPYLDAVIDETQRLYSVSSHIERECIEPIELRGNDGQVVQLEPGMPVFISTHDTHTELMLWDKPFKFNPARFLPKPENSKNVDQLLRFSGLTSSVAARFNKLTLRLLLVRIMQKFQLYETIDTPYWPALDPNSFIAHPIIDSFVGIQWRNYKVEHISEWLRVESV